MGALEGEVVGVFVPLLSVTGLDVGCFVGLGVWPENYAIRCWIGIVVTGRSAREGVMYFAVYCIENG